MRAHCAAWSCGARTGTEVLDTRDLKAPFRAPPTVREGLKFFSLLHCTDFFLLLLPQTPKNDVSQAGTVAHWRTVPVAQWAARPT